MIEAQSTVPEKHLKRPLWKRAGLAYLSKERRARLRRAHDHHLVRSPMNWAPCFSIINVRGFQRQQLMSVLRRFMTVTSFKRHALAVRYSLLDDLLTDKHTFIEGCRS